MLLSYWSKPIQHSNHRRRNKYAIASQLDYNSSSSSVRQSKLSNSSSSNSTSSSSSSSTTCMNCGKLGHYQRGCKEPITSFGIILIDVADETIRDKLIDDYSIRHMPSDDSKYTVVGNRYAELNSIDLNANSDHVNLGTAVNSSTTNIKYLMVSRKNSIGFVELVRGKYNEEDTATITRIIENMYPNEINMLYSDTFEDLLRYYYNDSAMMMYDVKTGRYAHEYNQAAKKFANLQRGYYYKQGHYIQIKDLIHYLDNTKLKSTEDEWGFPKGRKDKDICNMSCAQREFQEETGYESNDYAILNKIRPIDEVLVGTNGLNYKHVYYTAVNLRDVRNMPKLYDSREVGMRAWFGYDDALKRIRSWHGGKKKVLKLVDRFVKGVANDVDV